MKVVKIILFALLGLILALTGFIIYCFFNPDVAGDIGNKLYNNGESKVAEDTGGVYNPPEGDGYYENYERPSEETVDEPAEEYTDENLDDAIDTDEETIVGNDANNSYGEYDISPDSAYPFAATPYIAPDEGQLSVPGQYQRKSGLEIPKVTKEELEDPQADEIEETLGPGETGDGLEFQALYYPYYHMLDDKGKALYRQIYANANVLNQKFSPVTECNSRDVSKAMTAVFCDHPELFWLNTAYNLRSRRNGKVCEIDLSFNETANNLPIARDEFENAANNIILHARNLPSDFEKEKYVHDALADKNDYQLSAPMNQSAYSALVNGRTVCAGYARAMQYIMTKLGVPCYYCMGYAGENHAWNIINLDDDFYNVDVTWDDADPTNYDFFNKSDADYARNHARRDLSVNLPACNGSGYQVENPEMMEENEELPTEDNPENADAPTDDGEYPEGPLVVRIVVE